MLSVDGDPESNDQDLETFDVDPEGFDVNPYANADPYGNNVIPDSDDGV